eukprot:TRINITY_DN6844_c0_g1_i1.p1 TRINITY_DN6844_c0_g1~~TRINITY_DN6844_c0_g1_i1.p1  ORF type:complete len:149 (+),score=3.10 TRINITY_DN6844_c0_g1_i1:17-463(+)
MDPRYPPLPPEHRNCSLIPHMEFRSRVFDWSHKDKPPGRFYGKFQCSECGNSWGSAWTWAGRGQKCNPCSDYYQWDSVEYTQPYRVVPLERRAPGTPRQRKRSNHRPRNCEYCVELSGCTNPEDDLKPFCKKATSGDPYARAYTVEDL